MEYQEARYIRQMPSLSDLIRREAVYGRKGVFGSVKEALKQKFNVKRRLQAKMVGIKEKFDPMYWARSMFGKTGAALYGRAMGRSEADMQYFAGRARPLGGRSYQIGEVPKYRGYEPVKGGTGEGGVASKKMMSVLTDMHKFLVVTQAKETRRRELEANKREGREEEAKRRHKELIEAITGVKQPTATSVEKTEGEGIFGLFKKMIDDTLKSFEWIKDLKKYVPDIIKLFKVLSGKTLGLAMRLFGFIGNPMFLALALGALTILGLKKILEDLVDITPNAKALSPAEAEAALKNGSPKDIEKLGGRQYLTDIVLNGKKRAQEALDMNDGFEKDKIIRDMGGLDKVKQIAADTKEYSVPLHVDMEKGPEKVSPRPTEGGIALKSKQEKWDKDWGQNYDPKTGIRKDLIADKARSEAASTDPRRVDSATQNTTTPATPVTTPNAAAATVSQENASLKTEAKFDAPKETTINNQALNTGKIREDNTIKIAAVRNLEPSFQKMIFDSTRVV